MIFVFVKNSDIKREYKFGTVLYVFTQNLLQTFVVFLPLSVHLPQDNNFVVMERAWTAQRSKNTTHLYMQLDATIDDLIKVSKQRQ